MTTVTHATASRRTNYAGAVCAVGRGTVGLLGVVAIDRERCIAVRDVSEPRLASAGRLLVYAVAEAGDAWLVARDLVSGGQRRMADVPSLRPARGLGGGSWCFVPDPDGAVQSPVSDVVFVAADGNLWRQSVSGGLARRLTEHGPDTSAAAPCASPDGRYLAYVVDTAMVRCIDLHTGHSRRLDDGSADFCLDPVFTADGASVEWVAWNVPHMPWDHSHLARVSLDGSPLLPVQLPGAVSQPRPLRDGSRLTVRDDRGWMNLHRDDLPLVDEPFEHAGPMWGPGQRSYACSPDGDRIAFTRNENGFGRLCVLHVATGEVQQVAHGVHGQLSWSGNRLAAVRTGARTPTQVVVYDTSSWERTLVASGPATDWSDDELVEPEAITFAAEGGVVHARRYRATAPHRGFIVWLHGGPTDQWQVTFMPRIAFWCSRGWEVLVPDHRGSTGHGRAYQEALQGQWGVLDVADTVAAVRHAHDRGWGTPATTVLMGGSSGGFTALGAVAADPSLVAAAVVLYPVTDLEGLAERSHRFERHYTHGLVGPLPQSLAEYRRRSPLWHSGRFVHTPLLILHGDVDPVVPLEQSQVFAERVWASGGYVELQVYPGEGHGFRLQRHQLDEYERIERFLARHVRIASWP